MRPKGKALREYICLYKRTKKNVIRTRIETLPCSDVPHILVVVDGWQEVIRGSVSGKDGHMAKRDKANLITTEELLDRLSIKKMSTLRIYVSKYKIFLPVSRDPENRKRKKFDGRCCAVRDELLSYFPPEIKLVDVADYLNAICGEHDEILMEEFSQRKTTEKVTEEKINELEDMFNNGSKPEKGKKKDDKK